MSETRDGTASCHWFEIPVFVAFSTEIKLSVTFSRITGSFVSIVLTSNIKTLPNSTRAAL